MVEVVVQRLYEELLPTVEGFCGCTRCRDDVLVYALNRIPPRYVAQRTGEVVTNIAMESDQERARMAVVLMEAFRLVKAGPHRGQPDSSSTGA